MYRKKLDSRQDFCYRIRRDLSGMRESCNDEVELNVDCYKKVQAMLMRAGMRRTEGTEAELSSIEDYCPGQSMSYFRSGQQRSP